MCELNKLHVTQDEYIRLKELVKLINNKDLTPTRRKIARAQYETMVKFIINRNR